MAIPAAGHRARLDERSWQLITDEPYSCERGRDEDGVLAAGTPVVLMVEGPNSCRVVDGRGLYIEVRRSNLRGLSPSS